MSPAQLSRVPMARMARTSSRERMMELGLDNTGRQKSKWPRLWQISKWRHMRILQWGHPHGQDNSGRKTSLTGEASEVSGTSNQELCETMPENRENKESMLSATKHERVANIQENIEEGAAIELTDADKKLLASIQERLEQVPALSSKGCIVRVPRALRKVNEEAYTPQVVSIGPYHHGKDRLKAMEKHKLRYLSDFFGRQPKNTLTDFIGHLKGMEETVSLCYEPPFEDHSNMFVEIMLVDGCFIMELLFKYWEYTKGVLTRDKLFPINSMLGFLRVDMLLLENQLPLVVLQRLFVLFTGITEQNFSGASFLQLILNFFNFECLLNLAQDLPRINGEEDGDITHFLDLLRECCLPSFPKAQIGTEEHCTFIPSATELHEAGVKFRKGEGCLLDIKFSRGGVFQIPTLVVEDTTDILFRNLIAFEQCFRTYNKQYITHYLVLMDFLINSVDDVATLRHRGIVENMLGDNEQVSILFNKITQGVTMPPSSFYFHQLSKEVNQYYKTPWHSFRAMLDREYFYSPWSTASSIAVIIVLLCTILSTVCSAISEF